MQSILDIRSIAALAVGVLVGGQEAKAWCPTASDKTISCNNCTVTLTCDVSGIGAITITGYNATLDGAFHSIDYSTQSAIYVASDYATIKNVFVYNPAVSCITTSTDAGDWLILDNVSLDQGNAGLAHYYNGTVKMYNSGLVFNDVGYFAGYGNPATSGYADAYTSKFGWNIGHGMYVSGKPYSYMHDIESTENVGHGLVVENSPGSWIWKSRLYKNNRTSGKNGLRLVSSNNSRIEENLGYNNSGYDCITTSSTGVTASGNTWAYYSGSCN